MLGVWQGDLPIWTVKTARCRSAGSPPHGLASLGLCLRMSWFLLQREGWAAEASMGTAMFPTGRFGAPQFQWNISGPVCLGGARQGDPDPVGPQDTAPFHLGNKKLNLLNAGSSSTLGA